MLLLLLLAGLVSDSAASCLNVEFFKGNNVKENNFTKYTPKANWNRTQPCGWKIQFQKAKESTGCNVLRADAIGGVSMDGKETCEIRDETWLYCMCHGDGCNYYLNNLMKSVVDTVRSLAYKEVWDHRTDEAMLNASECGMLMLMQYGHDMYSLLPYASQSELLVWLKFVKRKHVTEQARYYESPDPVEVDIKDFECVGRQLVNISTPDQIPKEEKLVTESKLDGNHSCGWRFRIDNTSSCEFGNLDFIEAGVYYNPTFADGCEMVLPTTGICFCEGAKCNRNVHAMIDMIGVFFTNNSYVEDVQGDVMLCTLGITSKLYHYADEKLIDVEEFRAQPHLLANWLTDNMNSDEPDGIEMDMDDTAPFDEPFPLLVFPWNQALPIPIFVILSTISALIYRCCLHVDGRKPHEKLE